MRVNKKGGGVEGIKSLFGQMLPMNGPTTSPVFKFSDDFKSRSQGMLSQWLKKISSQCPEDRRRPGDGRGLRQTRGHQCRTNASETRIAFRRHRPVSAGWFEIVSPQSNDSFLIFVDREKFYPSYRLFEFRRFKNDFRMEKNPGKLMMPCPFRFLRQGFCHVTAGAKAAQGSWPVATPTATAASTATAAAATLSLAIRRCKLRSSVET